MSQHISKDQHRQWVRRYVPAEILSTVLAVAAAWVTYRHTGSFAAATASGLVFEGIGFYGYFITLELTTNAKRYAGLPFFRRVSLALATASSNLFVEFLPAELLDTLLIRPAAMFLLPQHIHPYPVGFLVGKLSADILFYALAIVGFESRKRLLKR